MIAKSITRVHDFAGGCAPRIEMRPPGRANHSDIILERMEKTAEFTGLQAKNSLPSRAAAWATSPAFWPLVLSLFLVVATLAVYYPVHNFQFVNYDDDVCILDNPHVKYGLSWEGIKWAFTTFYFANWQPLAWLSHALDSQMFGLNPGGHHDTNLLLHALDAVLLFWVLLRATGYTGRSFMVSALFALHPINVESVAWVAERRNPLSMLFFLLALGAYRWYAREPRVGRYIVVALLFVLGLMSKPQVITLPFVLLLWDYWPLGRMFAPKDEVFGTVEAPGFSRATRASKSLDPSRPWRRLSSSPRRFERMSRCSTSAWRGSPSGLRLRYWHAAASRSFSSRATPAWTSLPHLPVTRGSANPCPAISCSRGYRKC